LLVHPLQSLIDIATITLADCERWPVGVGRAATRRHPGKRGAARCPPAGDADDPDPVASGIVTRLDRPGGNTTGFAFLEAPLEASGL